MAIRKTSTSAQQSKVDFAVKCRDWLRNIEEQKVHAEMINRVRQMCDQAKEMRKPARDFILP